MASFGGEEAVLVEGFGGNATSSVGDEWRWLPTGLECFAASSGDALCLPLLAPVLGLPGGIVLTRDWPAGGGAGVQRAAELRTSLEAEASGTAGLVLFSSTDNWVSLSLEIAAEGGCEAVLRQRRPTADEDDTVVSRQALSESHRLRPGTVGDSEGAGWGVALRLELSEDGESIAGLIDTGYCLRLVGRVTAHPCPARVGIACAASSTPPQQPAQPQERNARFAGLRLLAMAPGRIQLHGGAASAAPNGHVAPPAAFLGLQGDGVLGGLPPMPGMPGLVAAPGGWTLSGDLQGGALQQVLNLIGADPGGAGGGGGLPYTVLDSGMDGGDGGGGLPYTVLDSGMNGAGGAHPAESGDGVTGPGAGLRVVSAPGGWTLSADLQGDALREVMSLIGADGPEAGGGGQPPPERAFYAVLEPPSGDDSAEGDAAARCTREVEGLHDFFVKWFTGEVARTDEGFRRFSDVMDATMEMVTAAGDRHTLASLSATIDCAHGCMPDDGGGVSFAIAIENARLVRTVGSGAARSYLVSYEEWQTVGDAVTARVSSALFREEPSAPNGVAWLHLHETYLPGHAPPL